MYNGSKQKERLMRKEQKKIFKEVMAGKSPNLLKNINLPIHYAQQTPSRINKEICKQTHHGKILKAKGKEKIL